MGSGSKKDLMQSTDACEQLLDRIRNQDTKAITDSLSRASDAEINASYVPGDTDDGNWPT